MFVELHLLQNFAPSNLNRDDTGAPKDCEFGGYRRARISSQCLKRAIRRQFNELMVNGRRLLTDEFLAHRTKRLLEELTKRLTQNGKDPGQALSVASKAIRGTGLGLDKDGKTQYLLFLGEQEIAKVLEVTEAHWESLSKSVPAPPLIESDAPTEKQARKAAKEEKKEAEKAIPLAVKKELEKALDGGKAADLALFGRMLADKPEKNIDAAAQLAHALSTNKVSMEMDYYTAVDDLKPEDTAGADMIGSVEFNSSCFYRYANIDLDQLKENLQGDDELAQRTVEAFIRASVDAIPTGKQNGSAAHNPPSFIVSIVREKGLWSLANAFVQPIRPSPTNSLVGNSIKALDAYWGKLISTFGDASIRHVGYCLLDEAELHHLPHSRTQSSKEVQPSTLEQLVNEVMTVVNKKGAAQ
jgi:CRISPR system Cascade subunit CasC